MTAPFQYVGGNGISGQASAAFTVSSATAAGDALAVAVGMSNTTAIASVTDSAGNAYTLARSYTTSTPELYVYVAAGATLALTTSSTVTVSFAGLTNGSWEVFGTDCPGVSTIDVSAQANGSSATPSVSGTPALAGETALAAFTWSNAGGAGSISAPFTSAGTQHTGSTPYLVCAYDLSPASGVSLTASASITSTSWRVILLTFEATAAPTAAPFAAPPGPARGRTAAVRGRSASSPGAKYAAPVIAPFTPPSRAAKGAPAATRGTTRAAVGTRYIHVTPPGPSPFAAPTIPARGVPSAVRGRSASSPGARYALVRISPFTPPRKPAAGRMSVRRGSGGGGLAVDAGSPQVARKLIISIAAQAGVDDYGNTFPEGIQVGSAQVGPQVQVVPSNTGGAAEVKFPVPAVPLSITPGMAAGVAENDSVDLTVSGGARSLSGSEDWVQLSLFSADIFGNSAHMDFDYIDTTGAVSLTASYNDSGWNFNSPVAIDNNLNVALTATVGDLVVEDSATIPSLTITSNIINNGNPLFGWSGDGNYPLNTSVATDGNSGTTWASGERAFMNNNWVAAINNNAALINYIYAVLVDAKILAS